MKRVYVCGPMSGYPQFNIPAFDEASKDLRERGYEVVSPAELDDPRIRQLELLSPHGDMAALDVKVQAAGLGRGTWGEFLSRDVKLLADDGIEGVVVLPGWGKSRGARLETFVARLCGIPVLHYGLDDPLETVSKEMLDDVHTGGLPGRRCVCGALDSPNHRVMCWASPR